MAAAIGVADGIRVDILISVVCERIIWLGYNGVRLNPAAQRRVVEACVGKVQAGFGFALAGYPRFFGG